MVLIRLSRGLCRARGTLKEYDSSTKSITILSTDLPSDPNDHGRNHGQRNKVDPTDVLRKKKIYKWNQRERKQQQSKIKNRN